MGREGRRGGICFSPKVLDLERKAQRKTPDVVLTSQRDSQRQFDFSKLVWPYLLTAQEQEHGVAKTVRTAQH
jgi:hypothetical protein